MQALHFYNGAAWEAAGRSLLRWKMLPKAHPFNHIQKDLIVDRVNPRFFHNFAGEDKMKSIKKLMIIAGGSPLLVLKRSLLRLAARQPQDLVKRKRKRQ